MRLYQMYFINKDEELTSSNVFKNKNLKRKHEKVFSVVRNSSLHEDLGQVSFLMSDKTGTLTKNKLRLKKIFVDGKKFAASQNRELKTKNFCSVRESKISRSNFTDYVKSGNNVIKEFLTLLSVCNTVYPKNHCEALDFNNNLKKLHVHVDNCYSCHLRTYLKKFS
ncbi:Phospholipid-transporting ATPase IB [Bonamia ostreae]|uniref:Phospholipid-transporting ATPase IB n=1 Tax=Bonamia ostreae TaxID=126728 RepID=A0ABV2ARK1_9EUKA